MSDLPVGVKDIAKKLKGRTESVEWSITAFLTDDGKYYATAQAGNMRIDTVPADDVDTVISYGANFLVDMFDELGVGRGA